MAEPLASGEIRRIVRWKSGPSAASAAGHGIYLLYLLYLVYHPVSSQITEADIRFCRVCRRR